jgi:predicted ribosome quality control (RQC) complex YloA/Tae2 family protein
MPPKDILVKVASFTVWFSKAKHTSYADVHFTEARYVHKRRHSPPGEVMLDQYKTLRVSPVSPQDLFGGDFDK